MVQNSNDDNLNESATTMFERIENETRLVRNRIVEDLRNSDPEGLMDFVTMHLGSFLWGAGGRAIKLAKATNGVRARDRALALCIPRLFNECYGAIELAKSGMALQSTVLLRTGFEVATLAILLAVDEERSKAWLSGKRIAPKEVRERLSMFPKLKDYYDVLSELCHPNMAATQLYSFPYEDGHINFYGGLYSPKASGQTIVHVLRLEHFFLRIFYEIYQGDLKQHGLEWANPDDVQEHPDITWMEFLAPFEGMVNDLGQFIESMPDDHEKVAGTAYWAAADTE